MNPKHRITLSAALLALFCCPDLNAASEPELAPLPIKLPKPSWERFGPKHKHIPNLPKPTGKARPPFYAPVGCRNLAANKPVTASDTEPIIGELKMITDTKKSYKDGFWMELGPRLQHVQIDLGKEAEIHAILFWHYFRTRRVYFDVIVQVSNDKTFSNATTLFNNDHDNSAGLGIGEDMHYAETAEGKLVNAKGFKARYVRLYSNGNNVNDLNHYIEIEVYGK